MIVPRFGRRIRDRGRRGAADHSHDVAVADPIRWILDDLIMRPETRCDFDDRP
jgi:hypothetical protein